MVEPISIPDFPPSDIWDSYIWFLMIPMVLRMVFLTRPFIKVTKQLAPHGGWVLKQIRELPIKGFGLLAFNEVLAFFIPMLLVFVLRLKSDPLGWDDWANTNSVGLTIVLLFGGLWIFFDLLRINRVRGMLKAIEKQNIKRLQKVADVGLKARGWLRRFGKKDKPEDSSSLAKNSLKTYGLLALKARKLTPAGLLGAVATSAAIEVAKRGAGKVSEMIDDKMQEEFEKISAANSKTLLWLFARDLAMGIGPLMVLWLVPSIFG
jgi:hypothetical protein